MALFVANSIQLKIGQKILLENVSFEIQPGQIIAIVGQNGSGKSSFLKILAGILDIDGGKAQITKGVKIGYLAQDFELDENLTSEEILQKYAQNNLNLVNYSDKKEPQNLDFTHSITSKNPIQIEQRSKEDSKNFDLSPKIENNLQKSDKLENKNIKTKEEKIENLENLDSKKNLAVGSVANEYLDLGFLDSELIIKMSEIDEKIEKILTKFQIPNKVIKELSGGQKRKLAIAQSLFLEPQILILDEPTNHLDIKSVEIVENILKNFVEGGKSVILVSHDRYFLDNLTNQFWEINNTKIYEHHGKWSNYLQNKQTRLQIMSQTEDKKQAFLKREIQWVRAGVKARSTKDKGRLERFYDLESEKNFENEKSISFLLPPILPLGNKILELENVSLEINFAKPKITKFWEEKNKIQDDQTGQSQTNNSNKINYIPEQTLIFKKETQIITQNNNKKTNLDLDLTEKKDTSKTNLKQSEFWQKKLENKLENEIKLDSNYNKIEINQIQKAQKIVQNLNFIFQPKTVLGIIGPNGSGKTTLIRAILGQIPFEGKIIIGQNTIFNYQDQNKLELCQNNSIFEELCEASETIKWGENTISSRKYLKNLLFENEQILTKIKNLSGGQKARILLAKILKNSGNCLILDEPTNDLDIETISLLEKSIQNFEGICIIISHDRYFLNQVCTDILALNGNGKFVLSTGNYDQYQAKIQPQLEQNNFQIKIGKATQTNSQIQQSLKDKNSWQDNKNRQKNLQKIEKLIESLESQIKLLELEFENVNLYTQNPAKYNQKTQKLENLKSELYQKLLEWEKLGE